MENSDELKHEKLDRLKNESLKEAKLVIFIGVFSLIFGPLLLSQPCGIGGFSETAAHIGDAIGGITAPITGLIGSILVFFALRAQIDANAQIQKQIEDQEKKEDYRLRVEYCSRQIELLASEINQYSATFGFRLAKLEDQTVVHSGPHAFVELLDKVMVSQIEFQSLEQIKKLPKLVQFIDILVFVRTIAERLSDEKFKKIDHVFLRASLRFHFDSKIRPAIEAIQNAYERPLPDSVVKEYNLIKTNLEE